VRARPLLPLATIATLLAGGLAHAEATPDFAQRLPLEVGGWKRPAKPLSYDAKSLYEYIDGGAELYISFGVQRVWAFFFAKGKDEIKVDLFDMGSSHNAFGVFAHGRERVETEFGQGSEYAGGLLTFWKDRYYVAILGYPETTEVRARVLELGRAVERLVRRTGPLPPLVGLLPRAHLVPASVRYVRHHAWLESALAAHDNLLGVGKDAPAALARYAAPAGRHTLVLVEYPDSGRAEEARRTFAARYLGAAKTAVAKVKARYAGVRVVGRRVVVVLDAPDRQTVERALNVRLP
jgi:hypothetical protein